MQNFMKTILNAVQTWTKRKIKDSTADWNQNDSNADNYVKNRTHWSEGLVEEVVLEQQTVSRETTVACSFVSGCIYDVIWDNEIYVCTAWECDNMVVLGNGMIFEIPGGEDVPFFIYDGIIYCGGGVSDEHTISITTTYEAIHRLDSKYLPTNLATTDDVMNASNPVGTGSFSMNRKSGTTVGLKSVAIGDDNTASSVYSVAIGQSNTASGTRGVAIGQSNIASGSRAAAIGGQNNIASGNYSHACGYHTIASSSNSYVEGKYNIEDTTSKYAHIIGNGTSDTTRSNAHTLDWDGNAWYQGDVYVGSTSGKNKDDGSKKLATEEYVDTQIAAIPTPDVSGQINTHNTAIDAHEDIRNKLNDKLNSSELPTAINTALAQAKASGEFDGKDGISGVYVGSGTPDANQNVQINPYGDDDTLVIPDVLQTTGTSTVDTMSQKAITDALNSIEVGGVTDDDIAAAVENYMTENPVEGVTNEEIATAVENYMTRNPISTTSETWTFTLEDGTTVSKVVLLG